MDEPLRFGVVADCQYEPVADEIFTEIDGRHVQRKFHRLTLEKLGEAVGVFNQSSLDFVVHLGDFTQNGLQYAKPLQMELAELKAPLYHALGNHDFDHARGKIDHVLAAYGMERAYHSHEVRGFRVIVLDTNDAAVYRYDEHSNMHKNAAEMVHQATLKGQPNAYEWNGGVSDDQLQWLERELRTAKSHGQKALLFSHHPLFPMESLTLVNAAMVLEIIDKYTDTVLAYFNGHNHFGAVGVHGHVPYITVPALLHGDTNAYGIVTAYTDNISVEGYGRVLDMEFER